MPNRLHLFSNALLIMTQFSTCVLLLLRAKMQSQQARTAGQVVLPGVSHVQKNLFLENTEICGNAATDCINQLMELCFEQEQNVILCGLSAQFNGSAEFLKYETQSPNYCPTLEPVI